MAGRVLIIEDDPDIIQLLSHVVRRAGAESVLASGGRQGLRLALKSQSGSDPARPDDGRHGWVEHVGGPQGRRTVAHHPRHHRHGQQEVEDYEQIDAHAGMFETWISKPFKVDELTSRITQILG